jgi:hypothetical protein
LWVGGGAHREIYQIAVPAMTLTNTIDVLHDNFNEVACNDGTYAYFGGVGNYICSVNCTTLAVTYGTVPADFGSAGMIHELAVDGTYLFGDLHQGGEQWKCSKTTLTGFVTAAGTGTLSNSEELLVDPTDTYVYNLTEAGGVTAVKRWSIADLSATSCVISDVVLGGLDSIVFLPDGSLLVSDCYQSSDTNGTTHLYRINPDFTYTPGQYLTVSGINSYAYRNNKIYLSSDTLYFIGGPFPTTSTTSIFSIPLGDIYQSQPAVLAAASIGYFGATISGTVDTGNIPATITVFYGLTDGGTTAANWQHSSAPTTPAQPQQTGAYSLTLSSLDQNTRYYYAVREVTALGTTWTPATQNFTTGQTMVGHFPLMTVLLQICPALIFMGLIFGLVFFSRRQGKEPSGLNLAGIIFFTMAMIMGLVMFQQIVTLFYNLLIQ